MATQTRELTVFVSSPSDLSAEREAVARAADAVNAALGRRLGLRLAVVRWEQIPPAAGRPQDQINPYVDECDVFVGLLRRRFGSDTGIYPSGFQEEFERVMARQSEAEPPKVALYFGRHSQEDRDDPGAELTRVLTFERRVRDEHIALHGQFDGPGDLELELQRYFMSVLAEQWTGENDSSAQSPSPSTVTVPPAEQAAGSRDEAREQVGTNLVAWGQVVLGEDSDAATDRDRLLAFALAVNPDRELLPVHTANRLYRRRRDLVISVVEGRLWRRSVCANGSVDPVRGPAGYRPGWYFFFTEDQADEMASLALDQGEAWQPGALDCLRLLRLRPAALWPAAVGVTTETDDTAELSEIEEQDLAARWQGLLGSWLTRPRAVDYLHAVAQPEDRLLDLLGSAVLDPEAAAEVAAVSASVRGDSRPAVVFLTEHPYASGDWLDAAVLTAVPSLDAAALLALVEGQHHREPLRDEAFDRLLLLPDVDDETGTRAMIAMLRASNESRDHLFARVTPDSGIARKWLVDAWATIDKTKIDKETDDRFTAATVSTDDLQARVQPDLDGYAAFVALSYQRAADQADRAREVLRTGGSWFLDGYTGLLDAPEHQEVIRWVAARARAAALRILAAVPAEHRQAGDVELVRLEAAQKDWVTEPVALLALAELAEPPDVPALIGGVGKSILRMDGYRPVLEAACRVGGREVMTELVADETEEFAAVGAAALCAVARASELTALLYNKHAAVRRVVLDALVPQLTRPELEELLDTYPAAESYFYDVVVRLDWQLYGRPEATDGYGPAERAAGLQVGASLAP